MPASWRASDLTILFVAAAGTVLLTAASFLAAPPDVFPANNGSSYAAHPDGATRRLSAAAAPGVSDRRDRSSRSTSLAGRDPRSDGTRPRGSIAAAVEPRRQGARRLHPGGRLRPRRRPRGGAVPSGRASPADRAAPPRCSRRRCRLRLPLASLPSRCRRPTHAMPVASPFVPVFGTFEAAGGRRRALRRRPRVWWASSRPLTNDAIQLTIISSCSLNALGAAQGAHRRLGRVLSRSRALVLVVHRRDAAARRADRSSAFIACAGALHVHAAAPRRSGRRAVEPRTSPLEFIDTMGGLYERAGAPPPRCRRFASACAGACWTRPDCRLDAGRRAAVARRRGAPRPRTTASLRRWPAREAAADPA